MVKMEIKRDTGNKIQFEKGRSEKVETIVKEKVFKKAQSPSHSYDGYNNKWSERRERKWGIRFKMLAGFLMVALLVGVVGYLGFVIAGQVSGLRNIELPMEQNLREVEVSIWETIWAADSFRLTGDPKFEDKYNAQIGDVDKFFSKYKALADTDQEKLFIEEFEKLWEDAKDAGNAMIQLTKEQKNAEEEFFVNVDQADDVIDIELQTKWSSTDPDILEKERAVREVEVSIWEAIHAATQYTGISSEIVRGEYAAAAAAAAAAETRASFVKGEFKDLMEAQFEDVEEFWGKYKALPHESFETTAIRKFDRFWENAVLEGRKVVSLSDQATMKFDVLFEKIDEVDDVVDFKMQEFIRERIQKHDDNASNLSLFALIITIVGFLVALIVGLYLSNSISRPINYLKDMTNEIGRGNLDVDIHVKTGDELEDLASSFNQMTKDLKAGRDEIIKNNEELTTTNEELQTTSEELKSSNEEMQATNEELKETTADLQKAKSELELHKAQLETKVEKRTKELSTKNLDLLKITEKLTSHNEEMQATNEELKETAQRLEEAKREAESAKLGLEKQVKDRTKQLESSKQDLEKQVEERTAELQNKVDQLEKFSNVATEREMKMISLKNKIKELEEKLGHSESEEEEIEKV
jgi:methyl-accepting chemotaxis protein